MLFNNFHHLFIKKPNRPSHPHPLIWVKSQKIPCCHKKDERGYTLSNNMYLETMSLHHRSLTFVYLLMLVTSLTTKILDFIFILYLDKLAWIVQLFSTSTHTSQKNLLVFITNLGANEHCLGIYCNPLSL